MKLPHPGLASREGMGVARMRVRIPTGRAGLHERVSWMAGVFTFLRRILKIVMENLGLSGKFAHLQRGRLASLREVGAKQYPEYKPV